VCLDVLVGYGSATYVLDTHFPLFCFFYHSQNIQKFREKAEKKQQELTQAEEAANGPDEEETLKRAALDELIQEAQEQTQKKQDLEADLKRSQEPHKATERQLHRLQQEQKDAISRVRSSTSRLQQKRDQIAEKAGSADAEEAQRAQALQKCEEALAQARAEAEELKQAVTNAFRAYEELEPYVDQAKQNCRSAAGKLGAVENKIRGLENTTGGSLAVFGTKCQKVKDMVRLSFSFLECCCCCCCCCC
jgi:chromosome segregation ATPase